MKQTKEGAVKKKEEKINIDKILQITSLQEAEEFRRIATGRKFCKIGERICDICNEEIERYNYENCRNIFVKFFKRKKFNKEKFMIENRNSSIIRALASQYIRNLNNENINTEELVLNVKQYILDKVNEYKSNLSKTG